MQLARLHRKTVRAETSNSTHPANTLIVRRCILSALHAFVACSVLTILIASTALTAQETSNPAAPKQKWLNTEQIETYLAGFFIKGVFHGTKWSSFFSPAGSTTYLAESRPPSYGEWKAENDRYCSQWPPSGGWDCYRISADGDNMTFVPLDGGDPWPGVRSKE